MNRTEAGVDTGRRTGEGLAKVRDTAPNHERERVDPLKQMSIGGPFRSLTVAVRCYQPVE